MIISHAMKCNLCKINLNYKKIYFYEDNSYCSKCKSWGYDYDTTYYNNKNNILENIQYKKIIRIRFFTIGILYTYYIFMRYRSSTTNRLLIKST